MQDPASIRRLEAAATRHPRFYRAGLAALAIGGDVTLTAVLVFPWAFLPLIGVLLIDYPVFYVIGAVVFGLLVWLVQPTTRATGRELRPDEAPKLFEVVAGLATKLRVPGQTSIVLDDSLNASAGEIRGLFKWRRVLTLGVPLLASLDRAELLAVIAHEFGHFSRRHGRLGHWLYRARLGWLAYLESIRETNSAFERAAAWYATRFVPYFSAHCFVYARRCEYEADADAAFAVGGKTMAAALCRIATLDEVWSEAFPRTIGQLRLQSAEPPADYHQRFEIAARNVSNKDAHDRLEAVLVAASSSDDTHPRLVDRLEALHEEAVLAPIATSAGEELFGDAWPQLRGEFDAKWAHEAHARWTFDHLRLKHTIAPAHSGETDGEPPSVERRLARARAMRGIDPVVGMDELRSLHAQEPADRAVAFAYASALLNDDEAAGVPLMEGLARDALALRHPAYSRLLAYFRRKRDAGQIDRWSAQYAMAARRRTAAVAEFWEKADADQAHRSRLSGWARALLVDAIAHDPCVGHACLLVAGATIKGRTQSAMVVTHGLALALDPDKMERQGEDEEMVGERYEEVLTTVIPPDEIPAVRTYLTTEPIPDRYGRASPFALDAKAQDEPSGALAAPATHSAPA